MRYCPACGGEGELTTAARHERSVEALVHCQSSPRCARCPARLLCPPTCPNNEPDTNMLVAEIFHGRPPRELPLAVRKQLAGLAAMHL